jgi:hypothetical protein
VGLGWEPQQEVRANMEGLEVLVADRDAALQVSDIIEL